MRDDDDDTETAYMRAADESDWIELQVDRAVAEWKARAERAEARVAALEAGAGWRYSGDEKPLPDGVEVEIRATALYDESGWDIYIMGDIVESFPAHCPSIEWRPAPPIEATP